MVFQINNIILNEALKVLNKVVPIRTTLPILSCVVFVLKKNVPRLWRRFSSISTFFTMIDFETESMIYIYNTVYKYVYESFLNYRF